MRVIKEILLKRQKQNELINVAIVGAGWFGSGVIRELYHWPGFIPRLVVTRTVERAIKALTYAGALHSEIEEVQGPGDQVLCAYF